MSEPWYQRVQREAAEKLEALLALPGADNCEMQDADENFDPWRIFNCVYGSYSSDFDEIALEVLAALQLAHDDNWDALHAMQREETLAHHMIREMLCVAELCEYGTSPRCCWPTSRFGALLPLLIEKWKAYYEMQWGEPYRPTS